MSSQKRASIELHFDQCPRCGSMADAFAADNGVHFAIMCGVCKLSSASHEITIWDVENRHLVGADWFFKCAVDALNFVHGLDFEMTIWEGDILVAHYHPDQKPWFYNGRCAAGSQQ